MDWDYDCPKHGWIAYLTVRGNPHKSWVQTQTAVRQKPLRNQVEETDLGGNFHKKWVQTHLAE